MADLGNLKETIEAMPVAHQIEILRLLHTDQSVQTNENRNGTFVNLTALGAEAVRKLEHYVKYVQDQQERLSVVEAEKARLQKEFFNGDKEGATS
tara:strand:+ start:265 stop:549 length:285 start_codon:yes stop_codon:yes gene_type:complete